MKGYHDVGGEAAGPIPRDELPWQHWEKQTEAIRILMGDGMRKVISLDELRSGFESFGIEKYKKLSFFRRRLEAIIDILERKGLITREELERELVEIRRRWSDSCSKGAQDGNRS